MYPYEDRVRAVRLYIKLGKRVAATIRQLGYPTKNSLKSWHQEHEQRLDLHTGYARAPKYSQAQKELAVEHTWSTADASQRRSRPWAIHRGHCFRPGSKSSIQRRARGSLDGPRSCRLR